MGYICNMEMKTGIITWQEYWKNHSLLYNKIISIARHDSMKMLLSKLTEKHRSKTEIYYIIK